MKKLLPILTGLLVAQVAAFAFLVTRKEATANFQPTEPLVAQDLATVDKIVVAEKEGKTLTLVKKEGTWVMPEQFDFPAAPSKVDELVKAVAGFKKGWPVGKTDIAAKQFNVVADKFERRIDFMAGETKLTSLFFGSSPSFRKVHARVDGDSLTYSVAFNTYEVPTASKEWVDHKYLALERSQVKEASFAGLNLRQDGGDFIVTNLPEGKETNAAKTSSLVNKALSPDFDEVLGKKGEVATGEQVGGYTLVKDDGSQVELSLWRDPAAASKAPEAAAQPDQPGKKEPESLVLLSSAHPFAFKVKKSKYDDLLAATIDGYVKDKAPPAEAKEGEATPTASPDEAASPASSETQSSVTHSGDKGGGLAKAGGAEAEAKN